MTVIMSVIAGMVSARSAAGPDAPCRRPQRRREPEGGAQTPMAFQ